MRGYFFEDFRDPPGAPNFLAGQGDGAVPKIVENLR